MNTKLFLSAARHLV